MTDRLNPEALEAACAGFYNDPMGLTNWQRLCSADPALADKYRAGMNAAVSAYLAALPAPRTITTVEGLQALPVGTVLRLARKELAEIGKSFGSKTLRATEWTEYLSDWGAEETEYLLPATVLHVPTEGGGE